jgi:hypothetical protein
MAHCAECQRPLSKEELARNPRRYRRDGAESKVNYDRELCDICDQKEKAKSGVIEILK